MFPKSEVLSPALLMSAVEMQRAKRLLAELKRHHEARQLDDLRPRAAQKGFEHFRAVGQAIYKKMDLLAAEVLQRELGLERYMVIHVIREGGYQIRMQILEFGFDDGRYGGRQSRWMWKLEGRKLRKDDTLGELRDGMCLGIGVILRRKLNGVWESLRWKSSCGAGNASAS